MPKGFSAVIIPVKDEPCVPLRELVKDVWAVIDKPRYPQPQVFIVDDSTVMPLQTGAYLLPGYGSLGASLLSGFEEIRVRDYDQVVVLDAGGSHDPSDIKKLLGYTEIPGLDAGFDVVVGSRFCPGGKHEGPLWRRLGSLIYGQLMGYTVGSRIHDWTSGYRVYSRKAVAELLAHPPKATGHAWQAEALAQCLEAGCNVGEVPITYTPSHSSLNWSQCWEAVGVLWRWWGAAKW